MQLYIDKKPAIIKKGTSIKLTRENPAITQSGDYTLDVTLPLSGCKENLAIFGPANYRAASPKSFAGKRYDFYLNAGKIQLSGTAIVTQISEEELKLQLLAGNSELNFDNREGGDKYIDELDLGRAYGDEWDAAESDIAMDQTPLRTARLLHSRSPKIPNAVRAEELMHGPCDKTNCVLFPIYSQADDAFANRQEYQFFVHEATEGVPSTITLDYKGYRFAMKTGSAYMEYLPNTEPFTRQGGEQGIHISEYTYFAPQPYLCFILERVLAAIGYTLSPADNCMRQGWFSKIFVANSRETIYYRECLPHWTVEQFLTELRNAFGIILLVDGKQCKAISRTTIYNGAQCVSLAGVIDEHTTDISTDENTTGSTTGNVSFNHSDIVPKLLNIGTDPYDNMHVKRVLAITQNHINTILESGSDEEKANIYNSANLYYNTNNGNRYGTFNTSEEQGEKGTYVLREIDQLGPLFRTNDYDSGTKLNIVPAFMSESIPTYRSRYDRKQVDDNDSSKYLYRCDVWRPISDEPTQEEGGRDNGFFVPYLVTADGRATYNAPQFSLQQFLETGEGELPTTGGEARDIMEVAVNAGIYTKNFEPLPEKDMPGLNMFASIPYPIGCDYLPDRMNEEQYKTIGTRRYFTLHGQPQSELLTTITGDTLKYDGRIVHQFSFTDHQIDPTALYLINGRRFACQKLELTIDEDGLKPLIKGYFFELQ